MADFGDALRILREASCPVPSGYVADRLWPDRVFRGSANGGPTGGQRAAAGLLGRLARRGLVGATCLYDERGKSVPPTLWRLTPQGRAALEGRDG